MCGVTDVAVFVDDDEVMVVIAGIVVYDVVAVAVVFVSVCYAVLARVYSLLFVLLDRLLYTLLMLTCVVAVVSYDVVCGGVAGVCWCCCILVVLIPLRSRALHAPCCNLHAFRMLCLLYSDINYLLSRRVVLCVSVAEPPIVLFT